MTDLREISRAVNYQFRLSAHQELISYTITDDTVMVALIVHKWREGVSRDYLTHRGTRIMSWERDETGNLSLTSSMTMWDEDFVPYSDHKIGRVETPAEYHARRDWEGMQHRVGTHKSPMDNAERSADPSYSPMHDYWMKG